MKRKKSKLPPAEIVTLRIPRAVLRAMDTLARKEKMTRTAFILRALRGDLPALQNYWATR